uniref:NADH-ubiquinone oxidoreductase chain 1 n=1 Tax=Coleoptera sp. 20 KM-2017 TaxID=2219324 RepID=A0A346RHA0_9COLE|nr:NADH dehydrogenase subunit 1 [Coleoptera sp. 20 KM-2017]
MILSDLVSLLFNKILLIILLLVGVAFLTLMERKVLGYIQIRKGPNKLGFIGLAQPFSDAIKLFSKEQTFPWMSNFNIYYFSPILNLILALLLWMCIPYMSESFIFSFSILYFLCISSLSVYTIMLAGWASNSAYSMLGSIRSVAQTISYEVSMSLILMSFLFLILSVNLFDLIFYQEYVWFIFIFFPLSLMWMVSSLAETNRTPFDFAEGESELVSGFNVEYSSGGFAFIFLAEYSNILFMSMLSVFLLLGGSMNFLFFIKVVLMSFFWIWVRGTLPRYRYDKLMYLAWKSYLPISLNYLVFYLGVSMFFLLHFL